MGHDYICLLQSILKGAATIKAKRLLAFTSIWKKNHLNFKRTPFN